MKRIGLALLSLLLANAQEPRAIERETALDRPLIMRLNDPTSVRTALVRIIHHLGSPGGIELAGQCSVPDQTIVGGAGATARDVLSQVQAIRPDIRLDTTDVRLVHAFAFPRRQSILDAKVKKVEIPDRADLTHAVQRLLRSPEILQKINSGQLILGRIELGYRAIPAPGQPPRKPEPLIIENMSLRESLDLLSVLNGSAIWVYNEADCAGRKEFTVDFDLR